MKLSRFLSVSTVLASLAGSPVSQATPFYPGVTVSTAASQFYPVNNLVQGAGSGFDAAEPHDALGAGASYAWVTDACGANCNYYDLLPVPVLIFDLGANVTLGEISAWGYSDTNSNGARDFSLRFATAAEGPSGFGASIAYNPTFTSSGGYFFRESFPFDSTVSARYVEMTCVNNYFGLGLPGGDRVGLGEVAFAVTATAGPADIAVAGSLSTRLSRTGIQNVTISVLNTGGSNLVVSGATLSGPQAAAFSVTGLPGAIAPVGSGEIILEFNPAGVTGSQAEVTVNISSNDPDESPVPVTVTGLFNRFYPITAITSTTEGTDLYFVGNLIQGEGIGFSAAPPYDRLAGGSTGLWVTDACPFPCDYLDTADPPVLVLDLGADVLLSEISTWGYTDTNSNGVSRYSLRFATDAAGLGGFDSSPYNPTFDIPNLNNRTSRQFSQPVTARYVEFTCLDNFFGTIAGGDRMGLGEIGFEIVIPPVDPSLETQSAVTLAFDGTVQSFSLPVRNGGQQNLALSGISFTGPDAAAFSVTESPANLGSLVAGNIVISFNPAGRFGPVSAAMVILSNDPDSSPFEVALDGILRDPFLSTEDLAVFSVSEADGAVSVTVPLTNAGASQTLALSSVTLEGPQAGQFSVASFPATLAPGQAGGIVLNLDPMGVTGVLRTSVVVTTNDPVTPVRTLSAAVRILPVQPLVAWWPLDSGGEDLSGNGHDGAVEGAPFFGNTGANAATGGSAQFFGGDSINVPYSPELNPTSFTLTLWVQPLSAGGLYRSPLTSRDDVTDPSGVHGYIIYNDINGNWSFWTGGGGLQGTWQTLNAGVVSTGDWVHLAIRYDEITLAKTFYLNGVQAAEVSGIPFSPNGPEMENLHIGSGSDFGSDFFFDGSIDDVALFSVPLSATDIATIASGGAGAFAGAGGAPFRILNITRNPANNGISLTWESEPGATYTVHRSLTLDSWPPLASNVASQGATTGFVDTTLPLNTAKVFYRVSKNP